MKTNRAGMKGVLLGAVAVAGLGALLAGLTGCQMAPLPPASQAMASVGAKSGVTLASLENGRAVLTNRCVTCHALQPLAKYSKEKWQEIVEDMAPRAKLSETQARDLLAYIEAARG